MRTQDWNEFTRAKRLFDPTGKRSPYDSDRWDRCSWCGCWIDLDSEAHVKIDTQGSPTYLDPDRYHPDCFQTRVDRRIRRTA